jgi:hypothetical protein
VRRLDLLAGATCQGVPWSESSRGHSFPVIGLRRPPSRLAAPSSGRVGDLLSGISKGMQEMDEVRLWPAVARATSSVSLWAR